MAKLEPLVIVIDTAEQRPWRFLPGVPTVSQKLKTADYAPLGFEDQVVVERKSLDDLVMCMTADRRRFEDVLRRMSEMRPGPCCVIVEATIDEVARHQYASELLPESLRGIVYGWMRDYPRVQWFFAGTEAARVCYDYLRIWLHKPMRAAQRLRRAEKARAKLES